MSADPASPSASTRVERFRSWSWNLIYLGLAAVGLGIAVRRRDDLLGLAILALGTLAVVAGIALIWWRSRLTHLPETR